MIMALGTRKMPLPMTVPITIATALHRPRTLWSDGAEGVTDIRIQEARVSRRLGSTKLAPYPTIKVASEPSKTYQV